MLPAAVRSWPMVDCAQATASSALSPEPLTTVDPSASANSMLVPAGSVPLASVPSLPAKCW